MPISSACSNLRATKKAHGGKKYLKRYNSTKIVTLFLLSSAPTSWILKEVESLVLAIIGVGKKVVHYTGVSEMVIRSESLELVREIVDKWLEDPTNEKKSLEVHHCQKIVCNVSLDFLF